MVKKHHKGTVCETLDLREREISKDVYCTYQRCDRFEVFQMATCRPVAGGTCYLNEASLGKTCKTAMPFLTQLGRRRRWDTVCVWAGSVWWKVTTPWLVFFGDLTIKFQ